MDKNSYQILLDEVRQNFASVVWTHKIQEKQADIYSQQFKWMETCSIIFSAATTCGIITTIFLDGLFSKIIAAILSFGVLFISAYFKSFDLKSMEQQHRLAASKFLMIRNKLLHLIAEIKMKDVEISLLQKEYKSIMEDLNDLFLSAPSTTKEAVKLAEEALNENHEYTYTQEEIDRFLPTSLRGGIE